jgi:RimJ/RimL family protein N-acetyltransferase
MVAAVARMSDETRYHRYHHYQGELPDEVLDRLLDVDHRMSEALVAVAPDTDEIVGGARFTRDPERPEVADLAVIVTDDWQQRGLASHLLWRLGRRAAELGVRRFTAVILATAHPMLRLVQQLGPVELSMQGTTVHARMEIDEWPDVDPSAA